MRRVLRSPITPNRSQAGMISIMTAVVLMMVISLIVFGFAQLSRRNQRITLDRQLSTQAFYAAESGVNDVRRIIQDALAVDPATAIPDITSCKDPLPSFYDKFVPVIDDTKGIKITCVTVDANPEVLSYSSVGSKHAFVIPVVSSNAANPVPPAPFPIDRIDLEVQANPSPTTASDCTITNDQVNDPNATFFDKLANWKCGYGVLRVDIVPIPSGPSSNFGVDYLRDNTMTFFAVPVTDAPGATNAAYKTAPRRLPMQCDDNSCKLSITGLSATTYYMRVSSLYKDVGLRVSAFDPSGSRLNLRGAQAVVDVTGKASDVLRRIQVHMPLRTASENQYSDYAIQSTEPLCKQFSVMEGNGANPGYAQNYASVNLPAGSTNTMCQPW